MTYIVHVTSFDCYNNQTHKKILNFLLSIKIILNFDFLYIKSMFATLLYNNKEKIIILISNILFHEECFYVFKVIDLINNERL